MYLALCRAAVENNDNTIELVNKQHWINRRFNTLHVPSYRVPGCKPSLPEKDSLIQLHQNIFQILEELLHLDTVVAQIVF